MGRGVGPNREIKKGSQEDIRTGKMEGDPPCQGPKGGKDSETKRGIHWLSKRARRGNVLFKDCGWNGEKPRREGGA